MQPRLVISAVMQTVGGRRVAMPVTEPTPADGMSAYQQAQKAGFAGSEGHWLQSLKGDTRVKYVRAGLLSDAAGVAVVPLPLAGLAVFVSPNSDGVVMRSKTLGADALGKPIVTIVFRRLNTGLLGITLGNLATIGIFQASPGVVNFDLSAAEPTA